MKKLIVAILFILALSLNAGAANYYVDLVSGNDSTGDGSTGSPYLTPKGVSDGEVLSGGDEIRVKKSTITAITGTCTFTNGSLEIATDADRTGEVSAGDYVSKNSDTPDGNEHWWVVESVDADSINLYEAYWGSTEATTAYVVTPTLVDETKFELSDEGTRSSRIKITGGWDLGTETRDGYTATYDTSFYGSIRLLTTDFIELSYFITGCSGSLGYAVYVQSEGHYLHHLYIPGFSIYEPLYLQGAHDIVLDSVYVNAGDNGANINIYESDNITGTNIHSSSPETGSDYPLKMVDSSTVFLDGVYLNNSSTYAVHMTYCQGIYINDLNITETSSSAVYMYSSGDVFFDEPVLTDIGGYGFRLGYITSYMGGVYIKDPTFTSITSDNYYLYANNSPVVHGPSLILDISGVHYSYFFPFSNTVEFDTPGLEGPFFGSNTAEARSGTCVRIMPYSVDLYVPVAVGTTKVTSAAGDLTLSVYIKKDGSYNGQVFMYARQNYGYVVAPTIKTVTTSYVQYSITVAAADLTVGEYVELSVMASGSAGNIYIDDFSYSQ